MNTRWLSVAFVLVCVLAVLHFYALDHHTYWDYRWFDTPMHLLGGAMTGAILFAFLGTERPFWYIVGILVVALGWEAFEYFFKLSINQPHYYYDTAHDVANDCIGAMAVYLAAQKNLWHSA